jgi:hypothetical protein
MAIKPIPYKCIWCLEEFPKAAFTSESHVLPKCVGNKRRQVLTRGIVCDNCNGSFSHKVEHTLIEDPIFKTVVGILQLRDINRDFIFKNVQLGGINRFANMKSEVVPNNITIHTEYIIKGQTGEPDEIRNVTESKDYQKRDLALLSRAVHKIAFESLAYSLYVKNDFEVENIDLMKEVDIFDSSFTVVRRWVRYGEPYDKVRPVLRYFDISHVNNKIELYNWEYQLLSYEQLVIVGMNLYGDCHYLSLTSTSNRVNNDLLNLTEETIIKRPLLIIGDKLQYMK